MSGKPRPGALDGAQRLTVIEIARLMARGAPAVAAVTGLSSARGDVLAETLRKNFDLTVLRAENLPGTEREQAAALKRALASWREEAVPAGETVCVVTGKRPLPSELLPALDLLIDTGTGQVTRRERPNPEKTVGFFASPPSEDPRPSGMIEKGSDPHGARKESSGH